MLKTFIQSVKLLSTRKKFYRFLKSRLGFSPRHIEYYDMALLHKSAMVKAEDGSIVNNERLEFLGDAILGAVIANKLFHYFPTQNEGFLTKTRAKIVSRSSLNKIGFKMELDQHIKSQSQLSLEKTHILGDAVEALIGAVYLDLGYAKAEKFILKKIIKKHINLLKVSQKDTNFKSSLIEWGQKNKRTVNFITEENNAADGTPPSFISKVCIDEKITGEGHGASKKEAQQNAAFQALKVVIKPEQEE